MYELNVSLWNTSYVFQAGHSVRITVSSSNSPRFKPNPNTGKPLAEEDGTLIKTTNTLHHSLVLPSRMMMPVVKLSQLPELDVLGLVDETVDRLTVEKELEVFALGLGHDYVRKSLQRFADYIASS